MITLPGKCYVLCCWCCLVTQSSLTHCDPHGLQHTRFPCPSLSPGVCSRSIESMMPSDHLILHCLLVLLPSILPNIRVFSNGWALHIRWPKYLSFSFSFSPSNEYSVLISFRMDWFDLFAVHGTLKSLFQYHNWKTLIVLLSLLVQLSHPHMTTGKTIAWTIQTLVGKVMSLLFNTLSRLS